MILRWHKGGVGRLGFRWVKLLAISTCFNQRMVADIVAVFDHHVNWSVLMVRIPHKFVDSQRLWLKKRGPSQFFVFGISTAVTPNLHRNNFGDIGAIGGSHAFHADKKSNVMFFYLLKYTWSNNTKFRLKFVDSVLWVLLGRSFVSW